MKEDNYNIYIITNLINNKIYIGMTNNPNRRWLNHKNDSTKEYPKCVIHRAIKKYNVDNFEFDVIESNLSFIQAVQKEQRLIALYNTTNSNFGYNLSTGGVGVKGVSGEKHHMFGKKREPFSEEWKSKISKSGLGRIHSQERRQKQRMLSTGRKHTEEVKQGMSERMKKMWENGVFDKTECKQKRSISSKGKNIGKGRSRPIRCNETNQEFVSINQASIYLNIGRTSIVEQLSGRNKTAHTLTFTYINNN